MKKSYYNKSRKAIENDFEITYYPTMRFVSTKAEQEIKKRFKKWLEKPAIRAQNDRLRLFCEKEVRRGDEISYEIRKVNKTVGYGVFAKKTIQPLAYIGEYTGLLTDHYDEESPYLFDYKIAGRSSRFLIDATKQGNFTRFINHSHHTPNVSVIEVVIDGFSHIVLLSNQLIHPGDELTFDYSEDYWETIGIKPIP